MRESNFKRSGSGARTVCKRFGRGYGVVVYLILYIFVRTNNTSLSLPFRSQRGGIPENKVQGSLHHLS